MHPVKNSVITGAAFLMATSAIGPGFLTQTAVFTEDLLASFGFVILISLVIDIGAQVNIWSIIAVSQRRAQFGWRQIGLTQFDAKSLGPQAGDAVFVRLKKLNQRFDESSLLVHIVRSTEFRPQMSDVAPGTNAAGQELNGNHATESNPMVDAPDQASSSQYPPQRTASITHQVWGMKGLMDLCWGRQMTLLILHPGDAPAALPSAGLDLDGALAVIGDPDPRDVLREGEARQAERQRAGQDREAPEPTGRIPLGPLRGTGGRFKQERDHEKSPAQIPGDLDRIDRNAF